MIDPIVTRSWNSTAIVFSTFTLVLTIILTLFGNIMVIVILKFYADRNMSRPARILTINLSLADIGVSIFVIPFVVDLVATGEWKFSERWRQFNAFGNYFFCIASILNLALLATDRYLSLAYPLKYTLPCVTNTRIISLCGVTWIYSALCGLPPLLGVSSLYCFIPNLAKCTNKEWAGDGSSIIYAILVVSLSYGLALLIMIFCYAKIFKIAKEQAKRSANEELTRCRLRNRKNCFGVTNSSKTRQEQNISRTFRNDSISVISKSANNNMEPSITNRNYKYHNHIIKRKIYLARTLFIVILAYMICWSPFCVILFIEIGLARKISSSVTLICLWIGYANSFVNPIIYSLRYQYFRSALRKLARRAILWIRNSKVGMLEIGGQ